MARGKSRRTLELIDASINLLETIQPATVRAVCYPLFNRGLIPSMNKKDTDAVGKQITHARQCAWIPGAWIVDETRDEEVPATWDTAELFIETFRGSFAKNHWALQPTRVEVWSEKGTVRGTLSPILNQYGVPFRVMHGFTSTTSIGAITRARILSQRPMHVLYVGDFDPSGMYMSEVDLPERLRTHRLRVLGLALLKERLGLNPDVTYYGRWHALTPEALEALGEESLARGGDWLPPITIQRIALTLDDVLGGDLQSYDVRTKGPRRKADGTVKKGDPRYPWYLATYGHLVGRQRAWELDAMSPNVLRARVEEAIRGLIDWPRWDRSLAAEEAEAESIRTMLDGWTGAPSGAGDTA